MLAEGSDDRAGAELCRRCPGGWLGLWPSHSHKALSWWDTCLGTEGSLLLFLLLLSFPKVPRPVAHSSLHRVIKFPYLQNQMPTSKLCWTNVCQEAPTIQQCEFNPELMSLVQTQLWGLSWKGTTSAALLIQGAFLQPPKHQIILEVPKGQGPAL